MSDYLPYLELDALRTATDAICAILRLSDEERRYTSKEGRAIRDACVATLERISRERRQACRKAARAAWRRWRCDAKQFLSEVDPFTARGDFRPLHDLATALEFRAAARIP